MFALGKAFDKLIYAMAFLGGVMLMFAMAAVCLDVIMRYFFARPLSWVLQVCEYILLYAPFLATAWVLRGDGHIKVDIVLSLMRPSFQRFIHVLSSILGFIVMAVITYYGMELVIELYRSNQPTLGSYRFPQFAITLAVPLGSMAMAVQFLRGLRPRPEGTKVP
jgi:TRAP-type C4-dicarboxylate transport system permease small subunit